MIKYKEYILSNGLTLIVHEDKSTPIAVVNVLYKVGSRNEHPDRTGFAHLFEHLMFGGSKHVPDYDKVLQKVGAENNAFTNTDITNYYVILGAENIETALWAESDRMQYLHLDQKSLEIQQRVVIEEFKQRYLNIPYGDVWLKLRPLAYKVHPYKWPTIGKKIHHIEEATLENVGDFYKKYYSPNNAILTISGNINSDDAYSLSEKWFGNIPSNSSPIDQIPEEPLQSAPRFMEVQGDVPLNSIYKTFHMPGRGTKDYCTADLLSDALGRGKSSRFHQNLVKERKIFNDINSYILGTSDPGLLVVSGKVNPEIEITEADKYISDEIDKLREDLQDEEVEKIKNQAESSSYFSELELLNRSVNLAVATSLGNTNLVNEEIDMLMSVTKANLLEMVDEIFTDKNSSTLHYMAKK